MTLLEQYAEVAGDDVVERLRQLADNLRGMKLVHINSTRAGGGVAEILAKLIPLTRELGIDASWEVISGESEFFECTKALHNTLQGHRSPISERRLKVYEETNARNAEALRDRVQDADFVFVHDPQPAPLLQYFPARKGKWVWRCHIDVSRPYRPVWKYLSRYVRPYDASIFSLADFAQQLPHPQYVIAPSIDPLSDKNRELDEATVASVIENHQINPERPLLVQVSRFDHFKDPLGVIEAYRRVKHFQPAVQLVLAGGNASDDPEGQMVLAEVEEAAGNDPDIHILALSADANVDINALQRSASIVLQKSVREGFGLTVTEAMWKGKPVIGGDVGGIRLQVVNHQTGFLVSTPEGAALRARYLLRQPYLLEEMGSRARTFVRENFLITRHLREHLTLMVALLYGAKDRIELS